MRLTQLLRGVEVIAIKGDKNIEVDNIYYDSKQLRRGGLFFSVKGTKLNGADFIDEAIERGALCIVSENDFITYKNICKVLVKDVRRTCAVIASNFYEHPSNKMSVIGITGTNGKTTTLHMVEAILKYAGRKCGTIGTISYNIGDRSIPAVNTTPSAIMLQMLLNEMVKASIPYCAMEVSSHSIHQNRIDGIRYKRAIFTNLTREHLDYHKDMEDYFCAKKRLFEILDREGKAIVNKDDEYGSKLIDTVKDRVMTYGIRSDADITAFDIESSISGLSFKVRTPKGVMSIRSELIGEYNIYNMLAAVALAITEDIGQREIEAGLKGFKGAPGRMQRIENKKNFSVFVDYAHTADALQKVLSALKPLANRRIITVFGCGGDRDRMKRPEMAQVASALSDFVIITNDNPRSEDPKSIADEIIKGLPGDFKDFKVSLDRQDAIELSLDMAKDEDIVLIAGKGHEKYQIFKDTVLDFDDCKIAKEVLGIDA